MTLRLCFLALLAVVTLTASANAATGPQLTTADAAQRSLRTANLGGEGEERGILPDLTKVKGAVAGVKSSIASARLIHWLNDGKSLDYAFTKLKLHREGDNLFKSPKLKLWISFRQRYNQQKGIKDSSGIATLMKHYDDKRLSRMIDAAKKDPETKEIAELFRAGQLSEWLRTKTHPDDVFKFLKVKGTLSDDANRKLWRTYRQEYNDLYITRKDPRIFGNVG